MDGEGEDGALAELAGDSDGAAVGLCDGAADGEAHAGAGDVGGALAGAVELVKDEGLLERVDADAAVGDGKGDHVGASLGAEKDGAAGAGIFDGIFKQVAEELREPFGVGFDLREVGREGEGEGVLGEQAGGGLNGALGELGGGLRYEAHADFERVELGHFDGLSDEAVEAVGFFFDDGEQVGGAGSVETGGAESRDGDLDGSKGGTELVGDGIHHHGAEALAFLGGLGAGDLFDGAGAIERDGNEATDSLEGAGGELRAAQDEDAAGADAGVQGDDGFLGDGVVRDLGGIAEGTELDGAERRRGWGTLAVELVALEEIEDDGRGMGGAGDGAGNGVGEDGQLVGLEELAAEGVENFELGLAKDGLARLHADTLGHAAGNDGGDEEDEEGDEVLRVGYGEGVDGWEKEEVVAGGGGDGADDGETQAPARGQE